MNPDEFVKKYEVALGTQNWEKIESLISESACVVFSNGKVHRGKRNIQVAFENNFSKIKNEEYRINNVVWLKRESNFAVYLFEFKWSGIVREELMSGNGMGTAVLVKEDENWKLLSEHLGKK